MSKRTKIILGLLLVIGYFKIPFLHNLILGLIALAVGGYVLVIFVVGLIAAAFVGISSGLSNDHKGMHSTICDKGVDIQHSTIDYACRGCPWRRGSICTYF